MTGTLRIDPMDATLGAVVTGVDLADLDDDAWIGIHHAFLDRAVLVFPGQHLAPDAQIAFGRRFGELSIELLWLSNRREDGSLVADDDPMRLLLEGNEGWHTDSSFKRLAAKASILSAREVPSRGGETGWADMRAAYDALDPQLRARLADLCAHHSLVYSQSKVGAAAGTTAAAVASLDYAGGAQRPDVPTSPVGERTDPLRPLVKVHPETGRPALFIGRHAYGIPGLEGEESDRLLDELVRFACRPPRVVEHQWAAGDVVVWDNRCLLHRARPYDHREPRVMLHTRVAGDPATELAA